MIAFTYLRVACIDLTMSHPYAILGFNPKGWQGETPKLTTEYLFGWVATKTLPILTAKKLLLAENMPEAEHRNREKNRKVANGLQQKPCKVEGE